MLILTRNPLPTQSTLTKLSVTRVSFDNLPHQFTAKTLNRQAKKAQKDENTEKARLKKVCKLWPPIH
jgi:2-methylisocitrate lyase-like PEP mutase family enzyme